MSNDVILRLTLYGQPAGKKNSQKVIQIPTGKRDRAGRPLYRPCITQGDRYLAFARDCKRQITGKHRLHISEPVNICALYYRADRRRIDKPNLENALLDILTEAGVIADDNRDIVAATDGSRVLYDKTNPRTEVTITRLDEPYQQWRENKNAGHEKNAPCAVRKAERASKTPAQVRKPAK